MCHLLRLTFVVFLMVGNAIAQEAPVRVSGSAPPSLGAESYFVQLIEFRMKHAEHNLTSDEMAKSFDQMLKEKKIDVIEHFRVALLENQDTKIQTGKTKTVTTGVVRLPQGQQ